MYLIRNFFIAAILCVLIMGCGDNDYGNASLNINLYFAPGIKQQAEITRVVVTISGPDIDTQEVELKVEGRKATGVIAFPAGEEKQVLVKAYAGSNVEFEGEAYVDHPKPGQQIELQIQLKPKTQTKPTSQADTLAIDFTDSKNGNIKPPWSVGFEFKVSESVTVGALCVWDDTASSGFTQDQQVGLWKSDGTLLTSVFVTSSDPTTGGGTKGKWRFHDITPIILIPGTNYIVASQGGEPMVYLPVSPVWNSRVTYIKNRYVDTAGRNDPLIFPSNTDSPGWGDPGYFGANFMVMGNDI
ncbi:MAG: hypothetical protein QG641_2249 [Candidatus Poribacteria bacterium]|nr:hypothetical protein [Candidatus Poribacteria bacterium]